MTGFELVDIKALEEQIRHLGQVEESRGRAIADFDSRQRAQEERLNNVERHLEYVEYEGVIPLSKGHNDLVEDFKERDRVARGAVAIAVLAVTIAAFALRRNS